MIMWNRLSCFLFAIWFVQHTTMIEYAWARMSTTAVGGEAPKLGFMPLESLPGELPALPREEIPQQGVDLPDLMLKAYEIADLYPQDEFFIDKKIDALDYEPIEAFKFVRDQILFEPYKGELRGAQGALNARAANSLDRSLLLSAILEDMGYETRLVKGRIDPQKKKLLVDSLGARAGFTEYDFRPIAALAGFSAPVMSRLQARANRDLSWLNSALKGKALSPRPGEVGDEHYWVQARLESDWTHLDTSFKSSMPGQAFGTVDSYHAKPHEADRHKVKLMVVTESLSSGRLVESTVLEREFVASEMNHKNVFLTFSPRNPTIGGTLAEKFGGKTEFIPVLTVDDEVFTGKPLAGYSPPQSDSADFFFGSGKGAELAALYLDAVVSSPGSKAERHRRVLMDRVPSELRNSEGLETSDLGALSLFDGIVTDMQAVHQIVVSNGALNPHEIANNVGLSLYFIKQYLLDDPDSMEKLPLSSILWPIGNLRLTPIFIMERYSIEAVNELTAATSFIGSPRIYIFSEVPTVEADEPGMRFSIDLMRDEVDVIDTTGNPRSTVEARIAYGVLQTAFETALAELPWILSDETRMPVYSASTLASTGTPVAIGKTNSEQLPKLAPFAAKLDVAAEKLVVTSEEVMNDPGYFAWWSVSADGATKGHIRSGLGGVDTYLGWMHYVNEAKGRVFQIGENPQGWSDLNRQQQRQAMRDAVKQVENSKTWEEYKKRDHRQRTMRRSGKLPKTAAACDRGHTEYTLTNCASAWITMSGATFFGIILAATLAGAILLLVAMMAVVRAVRD